MWPSFPVPDSSIVGDIIFSDSVDCAAASNNPLLKKTVLEHPFNQVVQLVFPVTKDYGRSQQRQTTEDVKRQVFEAIPKLAHFFGHPSDDLTQIQSQTYFVVRKVPLHLLFHKIFITKYLLKGDVTAVSFGQSISVDDGVCITPSGTLILSVTDRTYHRLGVEGKPSILNRRKNVQSKQLIEIDVKSKTVLKFEKSKFYTRTFNCFRNSGLKFDIMIKWQPSKESCLSPLSIQKFFEFVKTHHGEGGGFMSVEDAHDITIESCKPSRDSFSNLRSQIPRSLLEIQNLKPSDDIEGFLEDVQLWSGSELIGSSIVRDVESLDLNSFGLDQENCQSVTGTVSCHSSGFFTTQDIMTIITDIEVNLHLIKAMVPFIVLIVHGFEETPVSWTGGRNEHGKKLSGENLYGLIMTASETERKSLLWRVSDPYDFSIEKL
jgi:hypothetical protein